MAARAETAESLRAYEALKEKHERMGSKVAELVELEKAFGSGGREAALKERIGRLARDLERAQDAMQQQQAAHQAELARLSRASLEAERGLQLAAAQQVASAHEEGTKAALATNELAVNAVRDALNDALAVAQEEARRRQAEAESAESERRRLSTELLHWRAQAESATEALDQQRALSDAQSHASEERIGQLQASLVSTRRDRESEGGLYARAGGEGAARAPPRRGRVRCGAA